MDSTDFDQRPSVEPGEHSAVPLIHLGQVEVVKYMKTVFLEEHLINNLPESRRGSEEVEVKEVLESLTGRTNWTEASVLEAKAKIEQYCLQP